MGNLGRSFIHASAFFRKEIVEVLRQPRLIFALVFGPFLILLLFGVGYRNEARAVRTLFVVDMQSELARQIEAEAGTISPQLVYTGMTEDPEEARRKLVANEIDMIVAVPENANDLIRNNQQAPFKIYHNEIDPAQVGYIEYLGQIYVEEVNRRVLTTLAQQGQQDAASVQTDVRAARENVAAMKSALQAGNVSEARGQQQEMNTRLSAVALAVGASAGLLSGVEQSMGPGGQQSDAQDTLNLLQGVQNSPASKNDIQEKSSYTAEIQELDKQEQDLARLEERLAEFQSVSPNVLTRPFIAETYSLQPFEFTPMNFFTPGVIVLLLQHITITIAALSLVRERRSGAIELFRVSPVSSSEILTGKYVSYMLFGAFIAAVLGLLLAYGLQTPMLGSWWNFALVAFLVLFASLGIGFFISLVASTESQAVQFAMIALLLSVFFSGFILDLRYLWGPVRVVSWMLPATYGTVLLQNIMLRGAGINLLLIAGLVGIGVFMAIISWLLTKRQMAHD